MQSVVSSLDWSSTSDADRELVALARGEAQLRLQAAELLHVLFERGGHHDLGFSSIDAYVVERCRESARWGRETRALARRISERGLRPLRDELQRGRISWSMADLLSRHVTTEDVAGWLDVARTKTVREMQAELTGRPLAVSEAEEADAPLRPTRWLATHELNMLGVSRVLVDHVSGAPASDEMLLTALLGEAETTMQSLWPTEGVCKPSDETQSGRLRVAEHAMAEAVARAPHAAMVRAGEPPALPSDPPRPSKADGREVPRSPFDLPLIPSRPEGIDRLIVRVVQSLARRRLRLGHLARRVMAGRMWRRLGYASPTEYAELHLGLSLSSLEHQATLARRIARHSDLAQAVATGVVGAEAAQLIGRVVGRKAAPELVRAWIERGRTRTCKHLREEVNAVLFGLDLKPGLSRWPPSVEDLEAIAELERRVQSGELIRYALGSRADGPQTSVTLAALPRAGGQALAPLRLTLSAELYRHWQRLEAEFRGKAGPDASFVVFACTSLWKTWLPWLEAYEDKWAAVYRRDRHRCSSPVCSRRDVTPHHVEFRSRGGGDEDENMATLCSWCHLEGVHRQRISVEGRASALSWRIGRTGTVIVKGRRVVSRGDRAQRNHQ